MKWRCDVENKKKCRAGYNFTHWELFGWAFFLWSNEKADNTPTDKTGQVTFGMKQLKFQSQFSNVVFFLRNPKNKYHLWLFNVSQLLSSSGTSRHLVSVLVISWNKHEWTSECILFQLRKYINAHHFSSSSPLMLIYSSLWFVCWTKISDTALWLV